MRALVCCFFFVVVLAAFGSPTGRPNSSRAYQLVVTSPFQLRTIWWRTEKIRHLAEEVATFNVHGPVWAGEIIGIRKGCMTYNIYSMKATHSEVVT